uniref:BPTI/Kunitz inhibitor domain-containing protein n=1 Tax=Ciona savignyi TaxID=51511 RepID=H2Z6J4_CIOSA
MTSILPTIALLLSVFIIQGNNAVPITGDVGCYAARTAIFQDIRRLLRGEWPLCDVGGVWKPVQCNVESCFCAYVDTGAPISSLTIDSRSYSYFEMMDLCPVRFAASRGDSCQEPLLNYPCNVTAEKFTYNSESGECEPTTTASCYGFTSLSECQSECVPVVHDQCTYPYDIGQHCADNTPSGRYFHNPSMNRCELFYYSGCGGNTNNYISLTQCERTCMPQPIVTVTIQVDNRNIYSLEVPAWVLNDFSLTAETVNEVTQSVMDQIRATAQNETLIEEYVPTTPANIDDGSRLLNLGLPDINLPSFVGPSTEQIIRQRLGAETICQQPRKTGPCRALFRRWYFNKKQGVCDRLVYGGCDPNGNNFLSEQECFNYCRAYAHPIGPYVSARSENSEPVVQKDGELVYKLPGTTETTIAATSSG